METSFMKIENEDLFCKFVHECIDDLIKKKRANFNNYSGEIEWSVENFQEALSLIQNALRKKVLNKTEELRIPNLKEQFQDCLDECFRIRQNEIEQYILKLELSNRSQLFVENIDWKLKWVMGSSTYSVLREPLLQMQLLCLKRQEDLKRCCIDFEMNVEQIENLILELEAVEKELTFENVYEKQDK